MKQIFVDLERCMGCHSCELACGTAHTDSGDLVSALQRGEKPPVSVSLVRRGALNFPLRCHHCEDAPCIKGCMSGALYREESGAVICDREKCVGCWMCVMTCPYGSVTEGYDGKAVKCDLCQGKDQPACVEACPTKALTFKEIPEKGAY